MRWRLGAALSLGFALLVSSSARAAPHVVIELDDPPCEGLDVPAVLELLSVELGGVAPDTSRDLPQDTQVVHATCEAGDLVLSLDEPAGSQRIARRVSLADVAPKAVARLVALAVAEMIAARNDQGGASDATSLGDAPDRETSLPTQALPSGWAGELAGMAVSRSTGRSALATYGLGVGVRGTYLAVGSASLDLCAEQGSRSVSGGRAEVRVVSMSPVGWWGMDLGYGRGSFGAGARLGYAWLRGRPRSPEAARGRTVSGLWGGPIVTLRFAPMLPPWVLGMQVETGVSTLAVIGRAAGRRAVAMDGFWLGATVIVGGEPF